MLVLFMGPSGSGKTTLLKELCDQGSFEPVVRVTTRERRDTEVPGKDYKFVTCDEFKEMLNSNQLIEVEEYSGNRYYGTSVDSVVEAVHKNICSTITPSGLLQLCMYGVDVSHILVVLCSCLLKHRVIRYADRVKNFTEKDKQEMCDRMARDEGMFKGIDVILAAAKRIYPKLDILCVDTGWFSVDEVMLEITKKLSEIV